MRPDRWTGQHGFLTGVLTGDAATHPQTPVFGDFPCRIEPQRLDGLSLDDSAASVASTPGQHRYAQVACRRDRARDTYRELTKAAPGASHHRGELIRSNEVHVVWALMIEVVRAEETARDLDLASREGCGESIEDVTAFHERRS
jgi:hypothetical protein